MVVIIIISTKYDFSNKVVLITGGAGALGRSITKAFVVSNATTIVTYIIKEEMEYVKSEIKSAVELIRADITKNEEIKN